MILSSPTYKRLSQLLMHGLRHFFYILWIIFFRRSVKSGSSVRLDVVIPIIEKDLAILPLCIEGLRKNIDHEINDIYIVAPNISSIREFAVSNDLIHIDENTVLGYTPKEINYTTPDGLNRSGWIFQQLLKLSGWVGNSRYFLVIDADHILLQPHSFITEKGEHVFYMASWWHFPYYKNIKKLLKFYPQPLFSYITHKMIFDKEELVKLQSLIEKSSGTNQRWDKVILSSIDTKESSAFSEFELYGNYIPRRMKTFLPWREKALSKNLLTDYENLKQTYSKYLSVTFSSYLNVDAEPKTKEVKDDHC
jgi:hypothetical protein